MSVASRPQTDALQTKSGRSYPIIENSSPRWVSPICCPQRSDLVQGNEVLRNSVLHVGAQRGVRNGPGALCIPQLSQGCVDLLPALLDARSLLGPGLALPLYTLSHQTHEAAPRDLLHSQCPASGVVENYWVSHSAKYCIVLLPALLDACTLLGLSFTCQILSRQLHEADPGDSLHT